VDGSGQPRVQQRRAGAPQAQDKKRIGWEFQGSGSLPSQFNEALEPPGVPVPWWNDMPLVLTA
jgi:hypothetical protein